MQSSVGDPVAFGWPQNAKSGWICSRCGSSNSPDVRQCGCTGSWPSQVLPHTVEDKAMCDDCAAKCARGEIPICGCVLYGPKVRY